MRTNLSKFALAATLGFALTFTLSCEPSLDNSEFPSSSSSKNLVLSSSSVPLPLSSSVLSILPSSSSIALRSSSSLALPSSSSESPYKVECKIVNTEFPEGVKIPIDKRPELKCIEKANPSNVIKLHSDNDVGNWENDPPWSSPVKGKYDNIIVTIERDDKNAPCHKVKAKCEGTVTITGGTSSSSSTPYVPPVVPSSSSSITYTLACAGLPTSGTAGVAMSQPTVTCNGTVVPGGVLSWTPNINWSAPMSGAYSGIYVSASSGNCSGKSATCSGTLIVNAVVPSSSSAAVVASNCSLNGGTVTIGSQVWMSENLNCNVSGSKCYNDEPSNCAIYGRLYDWSTAMGLAASCNSSTCAGQVSVKHRGICPSGWHIPSDEEWTTLTDYVGGSSIAGTKLKAASGWSSGGNGTDIYGFSALPGGGGDSDGNFYHVGNGGLWWSASESNTNYAYFRGIDYGYENVGRLNDNKSYLFSVRCVQD